MQLRRNEFMTGVLVLATVAVLVFVLILLGAPGLFRPLVTYRIYFDNAAGIKLGAPVLLAGRKIGQVDKLYSPVSREEQERADAAARALESPTATPTPKANSSATPEPTPERRKFEARIDVKVDQNAVVFRDSHARLITLGLLGEVAIDFTQGDEASGRAKDGEMFAGERVPDFGEAIARVVNVVEPVAKEAAGTLKELQNTAQNLSRITDENSQLNMSLAQFRTFAENLTNLTSRDSSLSIALKNIERISSELSGNDNIEVTLQNFRESSQKLKSTINDLGPDLKAAGDNVKELTATVKSEPWRLIWPSKKKESPTPTPAQDTITVRKSTRAQRSSSPAPRSR